MVNTSQVSMVMQDTTVYIQRASGITGCFHANIGSCNSRDKTVPIYTLLNPGIKIFLKKGCILSEIMQTMQYVLLPCISHPGTLHRIPHGGVILKAYPAFCENKKSLYHHRFCNILSHMNTMFSLSMHTNSSFNFNLIGMHFSSNITPAVFWATLSELNIRVQYL